ncbi:putative transcription regulator A20-like family [Helianthus debilis subsp. tardiflorus]
MGTPAFPDLGKHCSVDDCKLIDFLPFTCDCCNKLNLLRTIEFVYLHGVLYFSSMCYCTGLSFVFS